jgi:pyridoxamine 5'-phosphate oxidase
MNLAQLRLSYTLAGLTESDLDPDPVKQFAVWMQQAITAEIREPNAMTLATATSDGRPSARTVLLKDFDEHGFVFYTNYSSAKGRELLENPNACLLFFWKELERQVRIDGSVTRVSRAESDEYFHTRPLGSQVGAWASHQSSVIPDREWLETQVQHFSSEFGDNVPLPDHWGGFRVQPHTFEFWQGRPSRLHDRLRYRGGVDAWVVERLSP